MAKSETEHSQSSRVDKEALLGRYGLWFILDFFSTVTFPISLLLAVAIAVGWLLTLLPSIELGGSRVDDAVGLILPLPLYLLKRQANARLADLKQRILE
jgi:hypothetical protein